MSDKEEMTPREYRGNKETIPGEKRARKLITDPARADAGEDAHLSETRPRGSHRRRAATFLPSAHLAGKVTTVATGPEH